MSVCSPVASLQGMSRGQSCVFRRTIGWSLVLADGPPVSSQNQEDYQSYILRNSHVHSVDMILVPQSTLNIPICPFSKYYRQEWHAGPDVSVRASTSHRGLIGRSVRGQPALAGFFAKTPHVGAVAMAPRTAFAQRWVNYVLLCHYDNR